MKKKKIPHCRTISTIQENNRRKRQNLYIKPLCSCPDIFALWWQSRLEPLCMCLETFSLCWQSWLDPLHMGSETFELWWHSWLESRKLHKSRDHKPMTMNHLATQAHERKFNLIIFAPWSNLNYIYRAVFVRLDDRITICLMVRLDLCCFHWRIIIVIIRL